MDTYPVFGEDVFHQDRQVINYLIILNIKNAKEICYIIIYNFSNNFIDLLC